MSPERPRQSPEIQIDRDLILKMLQDATFEKRIRKGISELRKRNRETGFFVCTDGRAIVVSETTLGNTTVSGQIEDYLEGKPILVRQSVTINAAKIDAPSGMQQVGLFHFHPDGNTIPSQNDAEMVVKRTYGFIKKSPVPFHKNAIHGIFAVRDPELYENNKGTLSCLFYGLGNEGLTSNAYQAWDALNQASGFIAAMEQSGFWVVKGKASVSPDKPIVWGESFVKEVAKKVNS